MTYILLKTYTIMCLCTIISFWFSCKLYHNAILYRFDYFIHNFSSIDHLKPYACH